MTGNLIKLWNQRNKYNLISLLNFLKLLFSFRIIFIHIWMELLCKLKGNNHKKANFSHVIYEFLSFPRDKKYWKNNNEAILLLLSSNQKNIHRNEATFRWYRYLNTHFIILMKEKHVPGHCKNMCQTRNQFYNFLW